MTEDQEPINPTKAVLDLVTAQRELAAVIQEQVELQREQVSATRALHVGVKRLVGVILAVLLVAIIVGSILLGMGRTLVGIARTNKANGAVAVQNGADIKATLSRVESVTGPEAQKRQAASTIDILRRNAIETDCRSRRQQFRIPAPDPMTDCASQTDPSVYPGIAGEPPR